MGVDPPAPAAPTAAPPAAATRVRYGVLAFLFALCFVLYIDRICISKAAPRIEEDLDISHTAMGFVFGAFTIAYGLFEVPTGRWGDRFGSRGVLMRIVLWWSAFTMLTGAVWPFTWDSGWRLRFDVVGVTVPLLFNSFLLLLLVRFLFGAGEAGALPNAARVLARWFPPGARGPAQGLLNTAMLVGGAVTPVVAAYLIEWVGWRWSFVLFSTLGVVWAGAFYLWFRDDPAEHPAVNAAEYRLITGLPRPWRVEVPEFPAAFRYRPVQPEEAPADTRLTAQEPPLPAPRRAAAAPPDVERSVAHPPLPWRRVLGSADVWVLGGLMSSAAFASYMYFFWYPTYLEKGRGVDPICSGWLAFLVLAGGAVGAILGGYLSDGVLRLTGSRRWGRQGIGAVGLALASGLLLASLRCASAEGAAVVTALACLSASATIASWWGVVTQISGKHLGALFGLMNSMGVPGAWLSQVFFGSLADWRKGHGYLGREQWDPGFYVYSAVLLVGAVGWLFVRGTRPVVEEAPADPGP
jgi:MFS family permease